MNISPTEAAVANFIFLLFMVGLVLDYRFIRDKTKWIFPEPFRGGPWMWVDVVMVGLFFIIYEQVIGVALYWMVEVWPRLKGYEGILTWCANFLVEGFTLIFLVRLLKLRYRTGFRELGITQKVELGHIGKGLISYCGALPLLFLAGFLTKIFSDAFEIPLEPQLPFQMLVKETSRWSLTFISVFIVCIAPFIEEVIFRGFLYPWLRKFLGIRTAMVMSSVLFAMMHFSALAFLPIVVIGLTLAYLYEKTGSLTASIIFHGVNNFMALLVFLLVYK